MELGSLFLILGLLVLVGLFVSRPFFESKQSTPGLNDSLEEHELSGLLAERDRVLNALQELDFDHALGKIPVEGYPATRSALLQRGAGILRQLDGLMPDISTAKAEDRLEAAIAVRRAQATLSADTAALQPNIIPAPAGGNGSGKIAADDELEHMIAARRRARQGKSAGFCPKCGRPVQKSDRFCPKCGTALT